MKQARDLIRAHLDLPELIDRIGDDDDLVGSGVDSGEVVRIALGCETQLGRVLSDDELARLSTGRAVADLLAAAPDGADRPEQPEQRPAPEQRNRTVD